MQIMNSPSTMVKKLAIFLLGLFAIINLSTAQVTVKIDDGSADPGQIVDIDVTLDNFNDIILFQYSLNWDETKFTFNSISNVTTELEQFSAAASIGTPPSVDEGEITVSWSKTNTQPESLPDDTRLFTLRLNAIGDACDESTVRLSNSPTVIEFVDSNTSNVGAVANNGEATINGTDCNGTGGGTLTVNAPDLTRDGGTNVCVPLTVTDFTNISSMTLGMGFDPAILSYTGVENANLPGFSGDGNVSVTGPGALTMLWFDNTGVTPATVTGTLMEVCFDVIGSSGQVSDVSFDEGASEFTLAPNDSPVQFVLNDGSVTVAGQTGGDDDFTLISGSGDIPMGGNACVPISVKNFDDIQSMQFAIMWDDGDLVYTGTQAYNLTQLTESNFNPTASNKLRVTWNNLTGGTSIADNTVIFEVCFEGSGDCDGTTDLMFTNDPPISIEVSNGSNEVVDAFFEVGTATVVCDGCMIAISNLSQPSCNGEEDGSIDVNLGSGTFNCVWTDASGATIQSGQECDITGLGAGTYTLTISDGADCDESRTFTLTDPAAIVFGGSKMDEEDNCDGSISLQMSGGVAPYSFSWEDGSAGSIRTLLCAGEYCVTATDANDCQAEMCFTINSSGIFIAEEDIDNVRCFGDDNGAIDITPDGGIAPYEFMWSGPSGTFTTEDISGLSAGNYDLTITDSSTPPNMYTGVFQVTQPSEITIGASIVPSDGDNGFIDISVSGGTGPYAFAWSPNGETTEDISGLAPGEYTVLVTDDNNCNVSSQTFVVPSRTISIAITSESFVTCNGECDGIIDGDITGGSGVYTFMLNGEATSFPVTDLCPGTYTLKVTDDLDVSESVDVVLTEPSALTIEVTDEIDCVTGSDGFIEVEVSGGTGAYTYQWSVAGSSSRITGLSSGNYSVLVEDENGCQIAEENIELESCDGPGGECFSHTPILSPNGDEFNNEFVIQCATTVENELSVFDRWGNLVFNMANYDNTWSGVSTGGDELPEGGYMWVLEVTNTDGSREIEKGTLTILRDQF